MRQSKETLKPGAHKKAIVKNAKARMIEDTFDKLERILRSRKVFRPEGYLRRDLRTRTIYGAARERNMDK